jgi:hypothetical protein
MQQVSMDILRFKGDHYQFGYKQGQELQGSYLIESRQKQFNKRKKTHFITNQDEALALLRHIHAPLIDEIYGLRDALHISTEEAVRHFAGYYIEVNKSGCSIMNGSNFFVRNYDSHPDSYEGRFVMYQPTDGGYRSMGPSMQVTGRTDGINEKGLVQITKDQPDVIVLTGDMIDRKTESFTDVFYLIDHLVTMAPVYFVMGNHEVSHPKQNAFLNALTEAGVYVLRNESVSFNHRRDTIRLVGVGDASSFDADLSLAFADVNATDTTILLSHTPDIVDQLSTEPVTLILSGHTHGGQIRLPLIGALIAPGKGLFKRRTKGLYLLPNKRLLYIDSGLGMSRIPVRLFNQSQYTVIDVTPEETKRTHDCQA